MESEIQVIDCSIVSKIASNQVRDRIGVPRWHEIIMARHVYIASQKTMLVLLRYVTLFS